MKTLMVKDIIAQRGIVIFGMFYSLFFYLMLNLTGADYTMTFVLVISSVGGAAMILLGSFKSDKDGTQIFMISLPVSRAQVVNAKFLLYFLFAAALFIAAVILGYAIRLVGLDAVRGGPGLLDVVRVAAGISLLSGIIPAYFAFGQKLIRYGVIILMVVGVVLQLVLMTALAIFKQNLTVIIDAVIQWFTSFPVVNRNLFILGVGLVILFVSYVLSRRIIQTRNFS